jgi:putative SOS response-associated peptidase YedK
MCGGVEFKNGDKTQRIYFPQPKATLPVRLRSGQLTWLPWGRRESEAIALPPGGWARLESVQAGKWDKYQPQAVLIPAARFMEKDHDGRSHWYAVPENEWLQGLVTRYLGEARLYVVTLEPPQKLAVIHGRWPRLVSKTFSASFVGQ